MVMLSALRTKHSTVSLNLGYSSPQMISVNGDQLMWMSPGKIYFCLLDISVKNDFFPGTM